MTASGLDASYFMSQLAQALFSLRAEIMIFLAAFCAHALLFGKYRIFPRGRRTQSTAKAASKLPSSACDSSDVSLTADDICKGCSGRPEVVLANLRRCLADMSSDAVGTALLGILQSAGRVPPVELLAAVSKATKERSLSLNAEIGSLLLRGYYACHLSDEFDSLLTEIEAEAAGKGEKLCNGVGVQALKGALRKGNFEASLNRLEALHGAWEEAGAKDTPSVAPAALLSWLARLALQQDCLPIMVKAVKKLGLATEAFPLILGECAQHATAAVLREAEALGRKEGLQFSTEAYCTLLKAAEDLDRATSLFSEAADGARINKDLAIAAAAAAFKYKSVAFADNILSKLPVDPPAEAAGKLLQIYATSKDNAEVLKIYARHFDNIDFSSDTATEQLIAEACISSNSLDALKKMLATTTDCTKRVALIKHFGTAGRLDDAFTVFRAFSDTGACLYNAVIDACIDGQRPEAAQQIMEEAVQVGMADIVTYNTIIKAHLLAGKSAEAQKTMHLMKSAGLEPNCVTFNELLDAAIKRKIGDVWPILAEMKACGVKPNHITGSILLKTIRSDSSVANVERVLEVLDSMVDDMDEVLLSSVVEACIRAGRVDLLMPHLKRQTSSKKVQIHGPHTYGSIIRAYGFVNDIAGVWDTWREMRTRRIVPTAVTLGCMVEAVVSNGDTEGGYQLIHDMMNDEQCRPLVNAVIYCSVLKGFSHQKKFDRLWQVYKEMLELKLQFSIVTFNTMVDACSRCGEMARIPALLESMVSQNIEPNLITYSAILKGYCQENRLEEAFELMSTCKAKFKPDEIMYNTLLDGCARKGLYDRGITLLAEMEASGVQPSNFTLSVVVKLCSRAKRLDRAFEMVEEISQKYKFRLNVHVYTNLIQACTQHNDLKRAFAVLERLASERIRPDTRTYTLLLRACVAAGEAQDAAGLMRAAVGLRGVHPRLMGYAGNALQPQGGLPTALISEIIEGMAGPCQSEYLALALLKDLRTKPNVKVDPKLMMRLTSQAARSATY